MILIPNFIFSINVNGLYFNNDIIFNESMGCGLQKMIHINCVNLSLVLCHRLTYSLFTGGYFELDENKDSEQAVVTLLAVGQALTDYIIKESFKGSVSRYRVEQIFTDSLMVPLIPINTKKGD